eukprot:587241-Pleurochrysis_carterae.AAC.1
MCALGAEGQKFTTFLVTPGIAPKLAHLESLRCTHMSHSARCGGTKTPDGSWVSQQTAAYPPDLNLIIARAIAALRPNTHESLQPATTTQTAAAASTVEPAVTHSVATDSRQSDPPPDPPSQPDRTDTTAHAPADETRHRVPFQCGLGSYSLRSSQPAALFVTRRH